MVATKFRIAGIPCRSTEFLSWLASIIQLRMSLSSRLPLRSKSLNFSSSVFFSDIKRFFCSWYSTSSNASPRYASVKRSYLGLDGGNISTQILNENTRRTAGFARLLVQFQNIFLSPLVGQRNFLTQLSDLLRKVLLPHKAVLRA